MRNQQPKKFLMDLYENHIPELRYDGSLPLEEWQKKAREKLVDLLGLKNMVKCDYDFLIEEVKEYDSFTQTRFTFQSEPGYYVACYIRIPHGATNIKPMICVMGHLTGQHISLGEPKYPDDAYYISEEADFCTYAIENGFAAVTLDQRYMGENGGSDEGPSCGVYRDGKLTAHPTLLYGRTAIGERVWDVMNLINVIGENFPQLDMDGVSLMGYSGGGTTTIYTGALDERIKFVMPVCAVCTFRDSIINIHHCACNYVPYMAKYFDMSELCGLVAPRKLVVVAGDKDDIFPLHGVQESVNIAKSAFKAAGVEDRIALVVGDGGHRFYAKPSYEAYKKMK